MSKRLLVIDDDIEVLTMMQEVLEYEGFDVKIQQDTADVFEVIDEYTPDLIMIDYILNGINGGETCHQIKTNPSTNHIPVVIISAYSKVILSLGNYKSDAFLTKPFELSELIKTVNQLLSTQVSQLY